MSCKYIIAIGSSAGGLKPMKIFFDNTAPDDAAYFILNHVPIDYQTLLKKILGYHSPLVIAEAADNLEITKNHIYLLPPGMFMIVEKRKLFLVKRDELFGKGNRAFDIFLSSLVKENIKHVIAIILSGAGSDGTKGISGIKEMGGKVIAQRPESCEMPSMPAHAINTGLVDYIADPEDMPALIHDHIIPEMRLSPES